MKIIYFITTMGHGKGGHFRSLVSTAEAMQHNNHIVNIFSIGFAKSPVINASSCSVKNFLISVFNLPFMLFKVICHAHKVNPDVLHAFDEPGFAFARVVALILGKKIVLTKCGGPSPSGYYPVAPQLTLFSQEDFDFFTEDSRFQSTAIHLISARTPLIDKQEQTLIETMRQRCNLKKNSIIFLRIARLNKKYFPGFQQIAHLIKTLRELNIKCCCVLIGVIEDTEIREMLKPYEQEGIFQVYTEKKYIEQGSHFLSLADCVIASGRGIMEASSLGLPVMCPTNDTKYPVMVTANTFDMLFRYNFSERASFDNIAEIDDQSIKILGNQTEITAMGKYAKQMFEKHFNVKNAIPQYEKIYKLEVKLTKMMYVDIFFHLMRTHLSHSKQLLKKALIFLKVIR